MSGNAPGSWPRATACANRSITTFGNGWRAKGEFMAPPTVANGWCPMVTPAPRRGWPPTTRRATWVAFHRPYKRLGVAKGDERRVVGVDHDTRTVLLEAPDGERRVWDPSRVAGNRGGSEVYRSEEIKVRAGDRMRWTRNDAGLGLVNSRTADVLSVEHGRVSFRLEDGRTMELDRNDSALRHLDHAWASTVHAFQGRTVDNVIAAMEASHPHLTTQKSFYVEISRARDKAELVTDNAEGLREQLEVATGERISALEGIGDTARGAPAKATERDATNASREAGKFREGAAGWDKSIKHKRELAPPAREKHIGLDLEL